MLGTIRLQQNRPRRRAGYLKEAIRLDPRLLGAHLNLAPVYLLNSDPALALDTYDAALKLQPDALPALQQAAGDRGARRRTRAVALVLDAARRSSARRPAGASRLRSGLPENGSARRRGAGADQGGRPERRRPRLSVHAGGGEGGQAPIRSRAALLEPLVEKRPADPQLQYGLGAVLYIQGRLEDAARICRRALRLQPEQLASHHYLALVARDQGHEPEAIAMLEALVQRYPDHGASCEVLGGLLMSAQRYDEPKRYLRKAVRLNPQSVKANYQLGLLLARMGRKEEADKAARSRQSAASGAGGQLTPAAAAAGSDQIVDRHP